MLLGEAAACLAHSMLRRRRRVLPTRLWNAACMRVVRWLESVEESMRKRLGSSDADVMNAQASLSKHLEGSTPPGSLSRRGSTSGCGGGKQARIPASDMPAAQLVVVQALICQVISALRDVESEVCSHVPSLKTSSTWVLLKHLNHGAECIVVAGYAVSQTK